MRKIYPALALFDFLFLLAVFARAMAPEPLSRPISESSVSHEQNTARNPDTPVWRWFGPCPSKHTLRLEVFLDTKSIYQTSFPLCAMRRSEIAPEQPQKILEFRFEADVKMFDPELKGSGRRIEGNIWEAGSEPDSVLLGISFHAADDDNRVLLNTIHIAPPDEALQSILANRLVIQTYPLEVE